MSKRAMGRVGLSAAVAGCLVLAAILSLIPTAQGDKSLTDDAVDRDKTEFDAELYESISARLVADETDLIEAMLLDYLGVYPLIPPVADFSLTFDMGTIPYNAGTFPTARLLPELTPETTAAGSRGPTTYQVLLWFDPLSWEIVVLDFATGREAARFQPPFGFHPADLIQEAWGERIFRDAALDWVLAAYSPSRYRMRYRLVDERDLVGLVWSLSTASEPTYAPMAMRMVSSNDFAFTAMTRLTGAMQLTIRPPENWPGGDIDIFSIADLMRPWWTLAATTNVSTGTTSFAWIDTGVSGVSHLRFYRAGDGETDSDNDGLTDARELLLYTTAPDDSDSFPVTLSGEVIHTNTPQTGAIMIVAVTAEDSWDTGRSDEIASPCAFAVEGVPNLRDTWLKAWRDWHPNGQPDPWEATGAVTNSPLYLTTSVSNLVIELEDPPASISGTVSYSGRQTGLIRVVAVTASNTWDLTHSATLSAPGFFHISGLDQTSYWVKAWIDADEDEAFDSDREASGTWPSNPIFLSNSVWGVDFALTDVDADEDGLPDWWEYTHFGSITNQNDTDDFDGDNMPNDWEYLWDFAPADPLDAMDDADADGYPNVYECVHDTDPRKATSAPGEGGLDPVPTPTITVTTNGAQTIQQALGAATNDYDIVAVADGVYAGAGNRDIAFPEHPVLLMGPGGYASVILDCQEAGRGLVFTNAQTRHTGVVGLTIRGARAPAGAHGGGIYMTNASPTIAECLVENCSVRGEYDGGGVYIYRGAPRLRGCVIRGNQAGDDGGGVRCKQANVLIQDCLVEDNSAGSSGGGLYTDQGSTATVSRTIFRWNRAWGADGGGGIRVSETGTTLDLRDSVLLANFASSSGGGLFAHNTSAVAVVGCTLVDNQAAAGASAIDAATAGTVAATNTLFSRNLGTALGASVTNLVACYTNAAPAVVAGGWRLLPNSPCLDAGTNLAWMTSAVDIDREPRIGNGVVDSAADEWHNIDGDGLPDAWEWLHFGSLSATDGTGDADDDAMSDAEEYTAGSDPLDAMSAGAADTLALAIRVSDTTSGSSQSESYRLTLDNGADAVSITNPIGGYADALHAFQKGTAYTVTLSHVASDYSSYPPPDYDHKALIGGLPAYTNGGHTEWTAGTGFLIHDPARILGNWYIEGHTTNFVAEGTNAVLYVLKAEFDHAKVNTRNLTHADDDFPDYGHCVAESWDSSREVNLETFLTAESLTFNDYLDWYVDGTKQSSSTLNYGSEPGNNEIKDYEVHVTVKDSSTICDRLILVVAPADTQQLHNDWVTTWSANTAWLAELPAAYLSLAAGNANPEPGTCTNQYWNEWGVGALNNYYHPEAAFDMRSNETPGGHGHQACYTGAGATITSGVSAGTADSHHYSDYWPPSHVTVDVLPFVRAAQLDGNAVWVNDLAPANFNRPMMYEGFHLQQYLQLRPPIPNSKSLLTPGTCAP